MLGIESTISYSWKPSLNQKQFRTGVPVHFRPRHLTGATAEVEVFLLETRRPGLTHQNLSSPVDVFRGGVAFWPSEAPVQQAAPRPAQADQRDPAKGDEPTEVASDLNVTRNQGYRTRIVYIGCFNLCWATLKTTLESKDGSRRVSHVPV